MNNGVDCNIQNTATEKTKQKQRKEKKPKKFETNENAQAKESASLNLQPSAVAGRSMVDVNISKTQNSESEYYDFGAENPVVKDKLNTIAIEYGKEDTDKAIRVLEIDLNTNDQNKLAKDLNDIRNLLALSSHTLKDFTDNDIEFVKNVSKKIKKNFLLTYPSFFYTDYWKELKDSEKENFTDWIEFCNKFSEKDKRPNFYMYDDSDKAKFTDNICSFFTVPAIRENSKGCIQFINTYLEDSPNSRLFKIINEYINGSTAEDIDKTNEAIPLLNNFYSLAYNSYKNNELIKDFDNAGIYYIKYADPKNIIKLNPIAKNLRLNIELSVAMAKREKEGNPVSDEHLKKVEDAVKDITKNNSFTGDIVSMMVLDEKNFEHYNKWLHFIEKNIDTDLRKITNTGEILNHIIFPEKAIYFEEINPYKVELYRQLVENKDVLDAVKNSEIDISNGIKLGQRLDRNDLIKKEDSKSNIKNLAEYKKQENKLATEDFLDNCTTDCLIEHIIKMSTNYGFNIMSEIKNPIDETLLVMEILATKSKPEIMENLQKISKMKQKTKKHYELYLNGTYNNSDVIDTKIENFYNNNSVSLFRLVSVYDKESIDLFMRKRFDEFEDYLNELLKFNSKEQKLLKSLVNSVNIDGKPFMPTQKIEFIDLLTVYKDNNLGTEKIEQMLNPENGGKVDLAQLKIDLFNKIMKNAGMTEKDINSIPKEKLVCWDLKHAHLLAKSIKDAHNEYDKTAFEDILKASNLYDFESYINDESNVYGKANANTKQMFSNMNLNYKKWIHPSKAHETDFVLKDSNQEQLNQIASQITEDMNTLMQTPASGYVKKQFPNFVKENRFYIPNNCLTNKNKLQDLVKSIIDTSKNGKMSAVWKRAKFNAEGFDPEKKKTAQNTLTIFGHLEQRLKDLGNLSDIKVAKDLNWKIKMWDRVPQKDLFQGNYSTCCIGMGETNGIAMPHYLMNTAYNMIEIVDNENEKTVGNALCYFVKTDDGKTAFVIDNIEINTNEKPSNEAGIKLRNAIAEYASKIAKDVTGSDNTPVIMSNQFNDVPFTDLPSDERVISFLGDTDCEYIYMDMFGKSADWTRKCDFTQMCKYLILK